ncbi:MAG TPA: hypothetical protein VIA18_31140, partial [Polyangia bacterium]|nr:hypothetical protein [Polyangia bacterium]
RPETTTSRRPMPETIALDGRASAELSGEIHIAAVPAEPVVAAGEIVIEIEAPPPGDDLLRDALEEAFRDDDRDTGQFVAVSAPLGFDDGADEKTEQRPLHPKKTSG